MALQITAISITRCSLKYKGSKPLQRTPVSSCGEGKSNCCLEHGRSCLCVSLSCWYQWGKLSNNFNSKLLKYFSCKKYSLRMKYVWRAWTLNLKKNDCVQVSSVGDIKEAITHDLWNKEQPRQSVVPAGFNSTLWSELIRAVSNIRVCLVRKAISVPVWGQGVPGRASSCLPFGATGGGREKLSLKTSFVMLLVCCLQY